MKLGRKNILTQGCLAIEMEVDKDPSCREEPHGSIGALLCCGFMLWRQVNHKNKLTLNVTFLEALWFTDKLATKICLVCDMYISKFPTGTLFFLQLRSF